MGVATAADGGVVRLGCFVRFYSDDPVYSATTTTSLEGKAKGFKGAGMQHRLRILYKFEISVVSQKFVTYGTSIVVCVCAPKNDATRTLRSRLTLLLSYRPLLVLLLDPLHPQELSSSSRPGRGGQPSVARRLFQSVQVKKMNGDHLCVQYMLNYLPLRQSAGFRS